MAATAALLVTLPSRGVLAQDSDGDGASDGADYFPCDASATGEAYAPAQNVHGVLLFEDNWPVQLDDDYQDAVITYHYAFKLDGAGQVLAIRATYNVLAAGGVTDLGLALQLPLPASVVASASARRGGAPWSLQTRSDANYTVSISSDLRSDLFPQATNLIINAKSPPGAATESSMGPFEVTIDLTAPQPLNLALAPFDVFVYRSANPAHEVHLSKYCGTAAMDATLFGTGIDASSLGVRCFIDAQGLPAALEVPQLVDYPLEEIDIASVYPSITAWAASGGTQNKNWYATPTSGTYYPTPLTPTFDGIAGWPVDLTCGCPTGYVGTVGACVPNAPAGQLAHWGFNEGSGTTITDVSGNGHSGTHNGTYVAGIRGGALRFTGTGHGTIPGSAAFIWGENGTEYTVSYWLNVAPPTGSWRATIHKTYGPDCCAPDTRTPAHFLFPSTMDMAPVHGTSSNGNDYGTVSTFPSNQWFHFAETHVGGVKRDYLDGVLINTRNVSTTQGGTGKLIIGYDGFYGALNGAVDEMRVYRRALSQSELQAEIAVDIAAP